MRRLSGWKSSRIAVAIGLVGAIALLLSGPRTAIADQLGTRSVVLSSYVPSAVSDYNFQFVVPSTSNIGSISFEFCTNSPLPSFACSSPAGQDVTSANLATQSGNVGFSVDSLDTTSNRLVISRAPGIGIATNSTYDFTNIINPSDAGETVYVRIATYTSVDATTGQNDTGGVAFFTSARLSVGAFVPPYLRLCVGVTVAPDCSSLSGDRVELGDLSSSQANAGQSQMAAGTNSPTGYNIYSLGTTMTSGNYQINSLSLPTASFPNNQQFGINLRANLNPAVGSDPVGLGLAAPEPSYNIPNRFAFNNGDIIASAPQPSDYNRLTVSYLVNVPSNQQVGVYSTTITYLIISQF